jgi:hypothetical protein
MLRKAAQRWLARRLRATAMLPRLQLARKLALRRRADPTRLRLPGG